MRTTRQKFNLILALALWLTMAQTAWAATVKETRTETWELNGGASGVTTLENSLTLLNGNGKRLYYYNTIQDGENCISQNTLFNSNITSFRGDIIKNKGEIIFSNLEGTVTKVELNQFRFQNSGLQMYIGRDKANTSTLLHLQGNNSDYDFPASDNTVYTSATFEGNLEVSQSNPLKILFAAVGEYLNADFRFQNGSITVTYEVEVEVPDPDDPGHTFSFNANGNTLTATCTETATYHHCNLGNGRKSTLTLTADDCPYTGTSHNASYNLGDFIEETGLTVTSSGIKYVNKTTGEERTKGPYEKGEYTACVTITIGSTEYTLTKDFNIVEGYRVNNNYSQFSVSPTSALEGEAITITYTQQMDESLDGLTLKGATSGNNIAYTKSGNTYTFNMPAEDVNLCATITYPLDENNITQNGDTYTIKTADGWDYFCRRLEVDGELNGFSGKTVVLAGNITVTTMAGSATRPFKGTFDGDGHTLTFNYTANMANCAPFCITDGATIRNLHATGSIEGGDWHYISGLVGSANGNLTIENCRVSTQISSTVSGIANNGGFVGFLSSQYNQCHITGCVFDGLICNSNTWNQTYGCGGFVGAMSQYAYVDLTDCLFLHGQYDNNGNKCELYWGYDNDRNSTFFNRSNNYGEGTLTNCFYVGTRGLKQGSPAVESADAPDNFAHFGTPTDHGFLKVYGHTMVFDGKYYTPTYGDLVETYSYSGEKSYIIEYDDMPLGIKDVKTKQRTNYLRYNRPFTRDQAVTIMLPFDFTKNDIRRGEYDNISEGKFYEFAGMNGSTPVMEDANEVTEMKANTPYLFMPGEDAKYLYFTNGDDYYQGFDIFTEGYERGTKETEYGIWAMKGTYTGKSWAEDATDEYILNDYGELEVVPAGTTVKPTGAYLVHGVVFSDLELTLPSCLEIVSVNGQKYSGNGHDFSTDDIVVIREKDSYDATNVAANCTIMDNGDGTYTLVISTHDVVVTADATLALTLANNSDNSEAIEYAALIGEEFSSVTLQGRTLYKDGDWNTLTLPFSLNASEIAASPLAGATIMTLNGTTSYLDSEGLLTLNFETAYDPNDAPSGSIVAGRPYIVKWKPQADLFINSTDDWNNFCTRVNNGTESYSGKTVRLTSNISVTKMAGTHSNPFRGTFEGDGYTIEVTLDNNGDTGTSDESYGVAPFRFTSGATIRNLHVGGTITTSTRKYAGGIVGKTVSGTNNIQNCWVSAEIYSTINGDGTHGGIVGKASGTVNITNCLFDGVLTTDKVNITHSCGGFVGWRDGALSIDHSMYAPAKLPDGKYTIGSNNTCTLTRNNSNSYNTDNCLYTQALGTEQGTNASAMSNEDKLDKLGSGWKISNNHVVPKMEVEQMPNIVNPVFSNVTVEDPATTEVSFNGGEFVGNFAALEITDANRNSVVLLAAGNKLGYAKTDRTIANGKALGACRAYFHIPSISGNAQTARSFVLNFGEENVTTGIIEVNTNTTNKSEGAFNLQGRRIVNPKKGLYIVNGKKIIIK